MSMMTSNWIENVIVLSTSFSDVECNKNNEEKTKSLKFAFRSSDADSLMAIIFGETHIV